MLQNNPIGVGFGALSVFNGENWERNDTFQMMFKFNDGRKYSSNASRHRRDVSSSSGAVIRDLSELSMYKDDYPAQLELRFPNGTDLDTGFEENSGECSFVFLRWAANFATTFRRRLIDAFSSATRKMPAAGDFFNLCDLWRPLIQKVGVGWRLASPPFAQCACGKAHGFQSSKTLHPWERSHKSFKRPKISTSDSFRGRCKRRYFHSARVQAARNLQGTLAVSNHAKILP